MKRHSAWFLASPADEEVRPEDLTEEAIINSMGDFSKEQNVLKRYARRGQCFSTAKYITDIDPSRVEVLEDLKRGGYTFTDGCGSISETFASMISERFNLPF